MSRKLSLAFKFLRLLGFNYPEADYCNVSFYKIVVQVIKSLRNKFLLNMMDWVILEPFNPRNFRAKILRQLGCSVGKNVYIGNNVYIDMNHANLITIEDGVHITNLTVIFCHKRDLSNYYVGDTYGDIPYKYAPVRLCKGCSTGTGTIIMPGVTIGEGAIVGAGSLVTHDIPAWTIATGRPAKVVKYIPKKEI